MVKKSINVKMKNIAALCIAMKGSTQIPTDFGVNVSHSNQAPLSTLEFVFSNTPFTSMMQSSILMPHLNQEMFLYNCGEPYKGVQSQDLNK
ncbi:hypothetical protein ACJIZ3_000143 [Penstemon smallii]|uniref:Uncharacterized protein n=1 Tax=Penstemon smallii TaxID=265156 RepID=A0ABD3R8T3_9LAMI